MYILLHTYTYAITVYVLLRCIAFFQRVYILCVYYNPLSMNLMYMPCSFLFIYLLLLTSSSNILFNCFIYSRILALLS